MPLSDDNVAEGNLFFSDRLLPRSSGHTLLPRYLMNSLNYFDKTDRKYKSLLMTWLHSVGPGHSRPSRWRGHPRWRWVVEVPSSCWSKTDVTPAILSRDFVAQLYRATKSQVWHGVSHNFPTVAQLLFRLEQRSILCNFVAKCSKRWLVNSCLCDKVAVRDTPCHTCDFVAR